jgi:diacylglycerol kinase family enzyme
MHQFGVISNPYARTCRKNPDFNNKLGSLIGKKGLFRITQSTTEIAEVLKEFKARNVSCVGIVGGDGSINLVLAELLKLYSQESLPSILVLGGGTANVLSINLGLPSNPLKVMSDFLHVNSQNSGAFKNTAIPSLRINEHVGFLFANGAAARFLSLFYKKKGSAKDAGLLLFKALAHAATPKTLVKAASPELNNLAKATPMRLSGNRAVEAWSKEHPNVTTAFVSTLKSMALGIPVFHALDGKNAEFLATSLENQGLAQLLGKILLRRPVAHSGLLQCLVERVRISTPHSEPYTIDGELFDAPKEGVIIEIGPTFQFITTSREPRASENEVHNRRHWTQLLGAGRFRGGLGSLSGRLFPR